MANNAFTIIHAQVRYVQFPVASFVYIKLFLFALLLLKLLMGKESTEGEINSLQSKVSKLWTLKG